MNSDRQQRIFPHALAARLVLQVPRDLIGRSGTMLIAVALCWTFSQARAGEIEPRSYVNTPVDINFALAGYGYSDGGLSFTSSLPIENAEFEGHSGVLAYVRTFGVWGSSGKFDMVLPYAELSGSAQRAGQLHYRNISGLNDPLFRLSVNFYGSPALSVKEFAGFQQDLIIGASVQVSAPFGQYDPDKLVNLGGNRWFVKPDIGISKAWGPLTVEVSTGVTFYSDNDDFLGGKTLKQDPLSSSQVHITYSFGRGVWGALSGTYDYGGRTAVDGIRSDESTRNSRLGVTLAFPVSRKSSIKLYGSTSMETSLGSDYDLYGVVWQHRWGEGMR